MPRNMELFPAVEREISLTELRNEGRNDRGIMTQTTPYSPHVRVDVHGGVCYTAAGDPILLAKSCKPIMRIRTFVTTFGERDSMSRSTIPIPFYKFGASASLLGALAVLMSCMGAQPVCAQDARTILRNMIDTYHGLSSYQGQSSALTSITLPHGKVLFEIGLTTSLVYQRPNQLRLEFTSPRGGNSVYYDGSTLAFFLTRMQRYSTAPVSAANLKELGPVLLKLRIASRCDTLYFLAGNSLPLTVTDIKRQPDDIRGGRPVYVITAHEKTPTALVAWTWMIDKQTNALAKIESRTTNPPGTMKFIQKKKIVSNTVPIESVISQSIISPKLNGNLDPRAFVFKPTSEILRVPFEAALRMQQRALGGSAAAVAHPGR